MPEVLLKIMKNDRYSRNFNSEDEDDKIVPSDLKILRGISNDTRQSEKLVGRRQTRHPSFLTGDCASLVSNKSAGNVISCRLDPRLGPGRSALSLDSSFHVDAGLLVASVTHLALPGTWTIHACRFYTVPCYAFDYRQCAQHVENAEGA